MLHLVRVLQHVTLVMLLGVRSRVIIFLFAVGLCSEPESFCVV